MADKKAPVEVEETENEVEEIINPAVYAFPELNPDEGTWIAVAKARAAARLNAT